MYLFHWKELNWCEARMTGHGIVIVPRVSLVGILTSLKSVCLQLLRDIMSNNLFFFSLADIFSVYPKIFEELVSNRVNVAKIYLPSDTEWQDKMYYMLLDVQKAVNEALECGQ